MPHTKLEFQATILDDDHPATFLPHYLHIASSFNILHHRHAGTSTSEVPPLNAAPLVTLLVHIH